MEYFNLLASVVVGICLASFGVVIKSFNNWYYNVRCRNLGHCLPPGDLGWLLIGKTYTLYRSLKSPAGPESFIHNNLVERHGRTGIYKTHIFGKPTVIVTQPETCKKVLSLDDTHLRLGYPIVAKPSSEKSLDSLEGAQHRHVRRAIAGPLSGHEALDSYVELIEDRVIASLDEWASMSMETPIELVTELKRSSFKVINNIFFGPNVGLNVIGSLERLCYDISNGLISFPINFPGFAFHKSLKAREKLEKILGVVVKERGIELSGDRRKVESVREGKCLLDLLLKNKNDERMDDEEIVSVLTALLFGGYETSAFTTMWAINYLHDHPTVLQTLKDEQEKIIRNRPSTQKGLTFKEIREMDFLAKVIQETFRRANIVFTLLREAKKDININGYTIPKGWQVMIMPRAVHMDPEIYLNPHQYDPSRWDNYNAKAGAFLPFGLGSRSCPGSDIARLLVTIFLHYFVIGYRFERMNPECPLDYIPMPRPMDNCLSKVVKL